MQKVEQRQNSITRADPHGEYLLKKKMKSLKSQEKRFDNISLTKKPIVEESINLFFDNIEIPKGKTILNIHLQELKTKDKTLAKNIELNITGPQKICIVGDNGTGKSTLIREVYRQLKTRTDIKVGYMPQDYEEVLKDYTRVLDFVATKDQASITMARILLGNMNFTEEEMVGKISDLSNGTKAKLFLSKFVLDKCNVLILDESTRNLSPLSNPIIRNILKEFKGTIISVSHD